RIFPTGFTPPKITPVALLGQSIKGNEEGEGQDDSPGLRNLADLPAEFSDLIGVPGLDLPAFNDLIDGGPGIDWIFGQGGRDFLRGGADSDYVDGGLEADEVEGGFGDDVIRGGDG